MSAQPPAWKDSQRCFSCSKSFGFFRRDHHCRHCGNNFCGTCTEKSVPIPKFGFVAPVRVCDACYTIIFNELRNYAKQGPTQLPKTVFTSPAVEAGKRDSLVDREVIAQALQKAKDPEPKSPAPVEPLSPAPAEPRSPAPEAERPTSPAPQDAAGEDAAEGRDNPSALDGKATDPSINAQRRLRVSIGRVDELKSAARTTVNNALTGNPAPAPVASRVSVAGANPNQFPDDKQLEADKGSDGWSAAQWVKRLDENGGENTYADLVATLRGIVSAAEEDSKFVQELAESNGIVVLAKLLQLKPKRGGLFTKGSSRSLEFYESMQLEVLGVLELLFDDPKVLPSVLTTPSLLPNAAGCIGARNHELMISALRLLTVLCWVSKDGRVSVVDALQVFSNTGVTKRGRKRSAFNCLLEILTKDAADKANLESKEHALILLNALINASSVLEDRVAMRRDLFAEMDSMNVEFPNLVSDLKRLRSQSIEAQLDLFESEMAKDKAETTRNEVDLNDPDSVFKYVRDSARENGFSTQLLEVLQRLATIPGDTFGEQLWNNVQYIVHIATMDDPSNSEDSSQKHVLSFQDLKQLLAEKEQLDVVQQESQVKKLQEQVEKQREELQRQRVAYESKIEEIQSRPTGSNEALSMRVKELETKNHTLSVMATKAAQMMQSLKLENKLLKEQVQNAGGDTKTTGLFGFVGSATPTPSRLAAGTRTASPSVSSIASSYMPRAPIQQDPAPSVPASLVSPAPIASALAAPAETPTPAPAATGPAGPSAADYAAAQEAAQRAAEDAARASDEAQRAVEAVQRATEENGKLKEEIDKLQNELKEALDRCLVLSTATPLTAPAGVPAAPAVGIPAPPSFGIPAAPGVDGVPAAPSFGIPAPPPVDGIPAAPSFGIPAPPPMDGIPAPPPVDGIPMPPPLDGIPAPPPVGGIPAPPPIGGIPGAPPIPGAPSAPVVKKLPPKKKLKPNVKMNRFHWTLVPDQFVETSMWDKLSEEPVLAKLDVQEFESLFCAKKEGQMKQKEKAEEKKDAVRLIDSKRAYNVDISLARIRISHSHIRDIILTLGDELTVDMCTQLISIVPTPEEVDVLKTYAADADVSQLANTEQFFHAVSSIPRIQKRLNLVLFKLQFDTIAGSIEEGLTFVETAEKEIKESSGLKTLFSIILAFGNYMNADTAKGGAYGFKLSALGRLGSAKTVDNSSNLLSYLVEFVSRNYPKVHRWVDEVSHCKQATRIESGFIAAEVRKVKQTLTQIDSEVKACLNSKVPGDKFAVVMGEFYVQAMENCKIYESRLSKAQQQYSELLQSFGEPKESPMPWEKFFRLFSEFSVSYSETLQQIEAAKEKKLKDEKRKADEQALKSKKLDAKEVQKEKERAGAAMAQAAAAAALAAAAKRGGERRKSGRLADKIFGTLREKGTLRKEEANQIRQEMQGGAAQDAQAEEPPNSQYVPAGPVSPRHRPGKTTGKRQQLADMFAKVEKSRAGDAADSVPPCGTCGCTDFLKHPIRPGFCNECFHQH